MDRICLPVSTILVAEEPRLQNLQMVRSIECLQHQSSRVRFALHRVDRTDAHLDGRIMFRVSKTVIFLSVTMIFLDRLISGKEVVCRFGYHLNIAQRFANIRKSWFEFAVPDFL